MTTSPTTIRRSVTFNRFDLSVATREFRRLNVQSGKALHIKAEPERKSWTNRTLEVRRVSGYSSSSFATPKSISVGGGFVVISSAEMEGVDEIEIVTAGGTPDAAGTYATITVTIDQDVAAAPAPSDDFFQPPGGGIVRPNP